MQQELIPFSQVMVGASSVDAVNARDLHSFLGVGTVFSDWIKYRIEQYGFQDDEDYVVAEVVLAHNYGTQRGPGQRKRIIGTDYYLTIDMAKELSMVENNPQGKAARKYFIECERRAKAAHEERSLSIDWENPLQVAHVLKEAVERIGVLTQQLENSTPRLDASYFPDGQRPLVATIVERHVLLYQDIQRVEQELIVRKNYGGRLREAVAERLEQSPGMIQRVARFGDAFFRLHAESPEAAGNLLLGKVIGAISGLHKTERMKAKAFKTFAAKVRDLDRQKHLAELFPKGFVN